MKTYKQQFDAITEAYIRDEIKPFKSDFCFCGTLCGNDEGWFSYLGASASEYIKGVPAIHYDFGIYTGRELGMMEYALLNSIHLTCETIAFYDTDYFNEMGYAVSVTNHPNYETALFNGMVAALEVLRQIHLEKGDETAQPITLQKRTLCAAQ